MDVELMISAYLDDDLTPGEARDLQAWLRSSPVNIEEFNRTCQLHWALHDLLNASKIRAEAERHMGIDAVLRGMDWRTAGSSEETEDAPAARLPQRAGPAGTQRLPQHVAAKKSGRSNPQFRIAAVVLAGMGLGALIWHWLHAPAAPSPVTAMLFDAVSASWDKPDATLQRGQSVQSRALSLKSGLAHVVLGNGVSLIFQGPARFRVLPGNAVDMDLGKLTAAVPAGAHGFAVQTPSGRVVDLGTEFGVSVAAEGRTEIQVFKGRVEATPRLAGTGGLPAQILSAGQAASVTSAGVVLDGPDASPGRFVRNLTEAKVGAASLATGLIHRYSFNDGTANDSIGGINGTLKGSAKVSGGSLVLANTRIHSDDPGVSYLEFRKRILPADGSVTVEAWFTSSATDRGSRLFDFGASEQGIGVAFLHFTLHSQTDNCAAIISHTYWIAGSSVTGPRLDDGKPHMVAVVIDSGRKKLRLYSDGAQVSNGADLRDNILAQVSSDHSWLGRSLFGVDGGLTGTIDEFRVYDSALSAAEITSHFKAGPDVASAMPGTSLEK